MTTISGADTTICELNQEDKTYVLNQYEVQNLQEEDNTNVVYTDASYQTVYIQNGQYLIPADNQTIVLQGEENDIEHYVVNDGETAVQLENNTQAVENTEVVQYYDEETGQIYCYTDIEETQPEYVTISNLNAENSTLLLDEASVQLEENSNTGELIETEEAPKVKRIKLNNQYVDIVESDQWNDHDGDQAEEPEQKLFSGELNDLEKNQPKYQYAILKDGKLHIQSIDSSETEQPQCESKGNDDQLVAQLAAFEQSITFDNTMLVDFENITGKNLITGQVVTLESYLDRLKKRIDTSESNILKSSLKKQPPKKWPIESSKSLVNRRFVMGKINNGKKLVGKIVKIEKKEIISCENKDENVNKEDEQQKVLNHKVISKIEREQKEVKEEPDKNVDDSNQDPNLDVRDIETCDISKKQENIILSLPESDLTSQNQQSSLKQISNECHPQIIIKKQLMPRENFKQKVSNILMGLMEMNSIQQQLKDRNIVLKLIEKKYDHSKAVYNKMVSFVCGHMEQVTNSVEGSLPSWNFVLDTKGVERALEDVRKINVESQNDSAKKNSSEDCSPETLEMNLMEMYQDSKKPTVSLSMLITIDKNGRKTTRVNIDKNSPTHCWLCNRTFRNALQLQRHMSFGHRSSVMKMLTCDICNETFTNPTLMQKHKKMHSIYKTYRCTACGRDFNSANSLRRHVTIHDPNLRPLQCTVCDQRFSEESALQKHLLIHSGIRAFVCEICGRRFVSKGDLNFHKRNHHPLRRFECTTCGRQFTRHSNLMRHVEIHKKASDGEIYKCELCGCIYNFPSSLTRHIVQNHISKGDNGTLPEAATENVC